MTSDQEMITVYDPAGRPVIMPCAQYKVRVANPRMAAIDAMPVPYRLLVHELGTFVLDAWRAGWSVAQIEKKARDAGLL